MGHFESIQEIVDLIIDHLFDSIQGSRGKDYLDDHRLLEFQEIALINKSFGSSCQKYLFSSVDLHKKYDTQLGEGQIWEPELDETNQQILLNLIDIFTKKPHLAAHLRTFTICMHFGNLVKRYETLATVLSLLQPYGNPRNLKMITSAMDYKDHRPDPDPSIFQRLHVQHLRCYVTQAMPTSIIANNSELKTLDLNYCRWKPNGVDPINLTARPAIKRLTIGGSLDLLSYLVEPKAGSPSVLDFSALEYVSIDCEAADMEGTVQQLLHLSQRSLKECRVYTDVIKPAYNPNFDLSSCTNLRTVCLRTSAPSLNYITDNHRIMDKFVTLLQTIPSPNLVEMLEIEFNHDPTSGYYALETLPWGTLDQEIYRVLTAGHSSKAQAVCSLRFLFRMLIEDDAENIPSEGIGSGSCMFLESLKSRFPITASHEGVKFEMKQELTISNGFFTISSSKSAI